MLKHKQSTSADQKTDNVESFNGQNVTENLHKEGFFNEPSEELFHREPVQGTPFYIIGKPTAAPGIDKIDWFITWNHYRLSAYLESKELCEEIINQRSWDLIGVFIGAVIEEYKQFLSNKKEN